MAAIIPNVGAAYSDDGQGLKSEDTVRTFQLTRDNCLDENPQITTVTFDDGMERFVIAWHTERPVAENSDDTESDIRLAALDAGGVLYSAMPESIGQSTAGTGDTIGANFRFAKNASKMEDLAILWVDSVTTSAVDDNDYTDGDLASAISAVSQDTGYDVLKAVKFVEDGNSFTVSGTVEVASMENPQSVIDAFDAYVTTGGEVKSVLLATNYNETTQKTVEISDGETERVANITVPNPVSGMYTATAKFVNQIDLSAVSLEYDKLYMNSTADIPFTTRNTGKDPITDLKIESVGGETYYNSAEDPLYSGEDGIMLNLMPNRDITVTARVDIADEIVNCPYKITATYGDGSISEYEGTLYLDIPDVGISKLEVTQESDGRRTLRYSLYNEQPANLADVDDGWRVQVGLYADQACTEPLTEDGTENGAPLVAIIDGQEDLALIDAGGYSGSFTFDISKYIQGDSTELQEIPEGGVTVYAKAWVEQDASKMPTETQSLLRMSGSTTRYEGITEYNQNNNTTSKTLVSLAARRGEDVTITSTLDNSGTGTSVTVDLQYNKIRGNAPGNLIVTLLDANGNPLEKLQSYNFNGTNQLLNLTKEGEVRQVFNFTQKGNSVLVDFSSVVLNSGSTSLSNVSLSGAQVEYDEMAKTYTATGSALSSGILNIMPEDPAAEITFNGQPYDVDEAYSLSLPYGTTEWSIQVSNGGNTETYVLRLVNTDPASGSGSGGGNAEPGYSPVIQAGTGGTVTTSPRTPEEGETVTITVTPEDGYAVESVAVTDRNGGTVAVTDNGDGTYTFVQPNGRVTIQVTFRYTGAGLPFTDVPTGYWAYDEIKWAFDNGYVNGTSATTFHPEGSITRQQVWMILARLSGAAPASMAEARTRAMENGISDGTNPGDPVTRQQLVALLFRYAGMTGTANDLRADLSGFPDHASVAGYAVEPMQWSVANNIIGGTSRGTLNPTGTATRAQFAAILYRFWNQID